MKINIFLLFLLMLALASCSKKKEDDTEEDRVIVDVTQQLNCLRWIDRDLFFGISDPLNISRNNDFHKQKIKDTLKVIEKTSDFGENYFRIKEKNPEILNPEKPVGLKKNEYPSFIQIWEDTKFEDYYTKVAPNWRTSSNFDKNAIAVVNLSYRRKYYIILRASCFESSTRCTNSDGEPISDLGVSALVARQFGRLLNLPFPDSCTPKTDGSISVMCPIPNDKQWTRNAQDEFFGRVNNQLNVIRSNVNFYGDGEEAASCLTKKWVDKNFYMACFSQDSSKGGDSFTRAGFNNIVFDMNLIAQTMNEIASDTLMGSSYISGDINYHQSRCQPDQISGGTIPIILERTDSDSVSVSSIRVWDDATFNAFVNNNEISLPDPNALLLINQAKKDRFTLVFRGSCFGTNQEFCDGGNGGISVTGTKALIARQLGLMVGLPLKDCTLEPDHVMCPDLPSDWQWKDSFRCWERMSHSECIRQRDICLESNPASECIKDDNSGIAQQVMIVTNSRKRFLNQLNNALEVIGNFPKFYDQYFEPAPPEEEDTNN